LKEDDEKNYLELRCKNGVPAKSIDAYLITIPQETRVILEKLRKTIKTAAPKAEEVISYQMPAFKYHGLWFSFAAFKSTVAFCGE
jgi:uncharacterized protein YdhG (YjbR/CyaY superfamily)